MSNGREYRVKAVIKRVHVIEGENGEVLVSGAGEERVI